jgi:hypothetical protein
MSTPASASSPADARRSHPLLALLLILLALLLLLFHQSLAAGKILFSSDGPLGANAAAYAAMPQAFTGMWQDLNWVGGPAGSAFPSTTYLLLWLLGPLGFAKFYAPVSILLLGLSAWVFFRQLGFKPFVCVLGGVAAALNTDFFSYACWGLGTLTLAVAATFLALAALVTPVTRRRWLKDALAGLAVGMAVMEGFDSGAILSVYVAAFVLFQAWNQGRSWKALGRGAARVAVVAGMAVFLATQALTILVGTQIQGVVGMKQDAQTREQRWDSATQWSLPKIETLRTVVAGLYGYRMDTPDGGNYWGRVGEMPGHPEMMRRHSGAGHYAGVMVVLLALFGLAAALRRTDAVLSAEERRAVWFWAVVAVVSMALAWGRHAPFYRLVYALPYFSTIRNPIKFLHPFSLAMVILFAYGLEAFWRLYADRAAETAGGVKQRLAAWWRTASRFDRRCFGGWALLTGVSALAFLMFAASRRTFETYLVKVVPTSAETAAQMASHSLGEVAWTIFWLLLTGALLLAVAARLLSGGRARWAVVALGLVLVADLARANRPWVVYWNFADKYAPNGLTRVLSREAWTHRVQLISGQLWSQPEVLQPLQQAGVLNYVQLLMQLYRADWLQHGFRYYNIQSLDVVQEPRVATDNALYRAALAGRGIEGEVRLWELTNTRFLLGLGGDVVTLFNRILDPGRERLRVHTLFTVDQARPGAPLRVQTNSVGPFALIEFTGALPRAKLYARWITETNDQTALQRLVNPLFDPAQTVVVSSALPAAPPAGANTAAGTVAFRDYAPKRLTLHAEATQPAVLLLNDKYDPDWRVTVDGQPAPLLRCNFLMRGVYLEPGAHDVVFRYAPSSLPLWVSVLALLVGLGLLTLLLRDARKSRPAPAEKPA